MAVHTQRHDQGQRRARDHSDDDDDDGGGEPDIMFRRLGLTIIAIGLGPDEHLTELDLDFVHSLSCTRPLICLARATCPNRIVPMVIVRSSFINGGAIIPIRWSSDRRRAQQGLSRTFATLKQEPISPSPKVRARSFRVRPQDAERFLEDKAYEATVRLATGFSESWAEELTRGMTNQTT